MRGHHRRILLLIVATILSVGWIWGTLDRGESVAGPAPLTLPVQRPLRSGLPHDIPLEDGTAIVRLPQRTGKPSRLLISTVAPPTERTTVNVRVRAARTGERLTSPPRLWRPDVPAMKTPSERTVRLARPVLPTRPAPASSNVIHFPVRHSGVWMHAAIEPISLVCGRHVEVLLDPSVPRTPDVDVLASEVVRLCDHDLIPELERMFGPLIDIDGDGRLAVLITSRLEGFSQRGEQLDGCVRAADFHPSIDPPRGNRRDLLYLNPHRRPGLSLRTLLAHELTHVVQFGHRVGHPTREPLGDWLTEAIAHRIEVRLGGDESNLRERLATFAAAPERSPLVVPNASTAELWRDPGSRAAGYRFLSHLEDHFGSELLPQLLTGSAGNLRAVEQATGWTFDDLLRDWSLALADSPDAPRSWTLGDAASERTIVLHGTATAYLNIEAGEVLEIDVESSEPVWLTLVP